MAVRAEGLFEGLDEAPPGEILFTEEQITEREREIAEMLVAEDPELKRLYVCVLKGGLPFFMDVMRFMQEITGREPRVAYIKTTAYDGQQAHEITVDYDIPFDIEDEDIVALDDVSDKNQTQAGLEHHLINNRHAGSFELIPLILKNTAENKVADDPKRYGFLCPDRWLGGMGMDLGDEDDPDKGRAYRCVFAIN